jgi:arylsulfatase A-like enzyme
MVVADQLRSDVLGAYGSPICRTPELDRLAAGAVRFETCITPTALCSPARASLLTGRFPHGHGILNNTHEPDALRTELPADVPTYPALLRAAGYRLGHVGKWHAGGSGPASVGYHDVVVHADVLAGIGQATIDASDRMLVEPVYLRYPHGRLLAAGIDPRPVEQTATHRDIDTAISFLERYASLGAPFFLRVDLEGPHHPYAPPAPYAALYPASAIPPWPNFAEDVAGKPAAQLRALEHRGVTGWSWEDWQPLVARYFAFVTFIDAEIGRLLAAVDRLGLADELVVIHTADHGDMTGSHGGQFNKGPMMYDEIYRIPLLVRAPATGPPGVCRTPVGSLALMPTILELAGVAPPPACMRRVSPPCSPTRTGNRHTARPTPSSTGTSGGCTPSGWSGPRTRSSSTAPTASMSCTTWRPTPPSSSTGTTTRRWPRSGRTSSGSSSTGW